MKTSESIKNLTAALVKAQAAMGPAIKGSANPFFKSSYASLPTIMEVVKGPLNENGLVVLQPVQHRDGKNFINTVILHGDSGEFISSETEVIVPTAQLTNPQAHGSAQTYARRFGLQAMLFIPAEDKDAEDLQDRGTAKHAYKPAYQAPAPKASPTAAVQTAVSSDGTKSYVGQQVAISFEKDGKIVGEVSGNQLHATAEKAQEAILAVAPLQKSSFRKGAKAPAATQAVTVAPSESEWG